MSFLFTQVEKLKEAAADLAAVAGTIGDANVAAGAPTTGVVAPGADGVSALVAQVFQAQGRQYQAISARAAAFHDQFVRQMKAAGQAYCDAEGANAANLGDNPPREWIW